MKEIDRVDIFYFILLLLGDGVLSTPRHPQILDKLNFQ